MPDSLAREWELLQSQFDSYEKCSLGIKLFSIGILAAFLLLGSAHPTLLALVLILWLQDAIWKTFQARIEVRLLRVEKLLAQSDLPSGSAQPAMQFNSEYAQTRRGTSGLLREYLSQACRPTVAFPHLFLLLLVVVWWLPL